jgi:hypothetical protein
MLLARQFTSVENVPLLPFTAGKDLLRAVSMQDARVNQHDAAQNKC